MQMQQPNAGISLWRQVPYESMEEVKAVGNSANAAVAAARLGLKSALLAHVGNDAQGKDCIEELKKNNVDTICRHS